MIMKKQFRNRIVHGFCYEMNWNKRKLDMVLVELLLQ